ncbi:family 43 glycosylhydrolase [Streptomyces sp. MA5143a]|uniref:family 43 glycosylhydrolase n=1 Tax=Streptomyces sp. MA5143a TaxID=2083010 RepID=UPI000D28CA4A|nr:family 43 glycosylhydrolase [Streptomyces sp. MA5143a]SPF06528.1 Extracellular exo-alpha-(1->5)-L-arabinofuranosidase precursor [Streptomyces sp. MA5143a]
MSSTPAMAGVMQLLRPAWQLAQRSPSLLRRVLATATALVALVTVGTAVAAPEAQAATTTFTNPLNSSGADPYMTYYNGNYYLMTTPYSGPLTMRKAPTIAALKSAAPVPVFSAHAAGRDRQIWAPEMHLLDGPSGKRWYIYYSAGGGNIEDQRVHVLESAGTDPLGPYTYKGMIFGANNWWGIDGSVVTIGGRLYFVWSGVPTPQWAGSDPSIYIVALSNPWTVTGPRTQISTPTLAWEKQGTPMNEGPVALQHDGKTFISYSASACQGPDYKLGLLTLTGSDPLSASSWTKGSEPAFQRSDANSVYGPGHNGFFKSPDGTEDWIVYHANTSSTQGCGATRTTRIQKITWNADGSPNLGVPVATNTALTVPSGEPEVTYYRLTNRNSGKVMDVQAPNTDDGVKIGQYTSNGRPWQQWRFVDAGSGYFQIESLNSGKCLDVSAASTADGAGIIQYRCHTGANQQFSWVATDGYFQLKARHSGKCVNVAGASTENLALLEQRTCGTTPGFQWSRS